MGCLTYLYCLYGHFQGDIRYQEVCIKCSGISTCVPALLIMIAGKSLDLANAYQRQKPYKLRFYSLITMRILTPAFDSASSFLT